MQSALWILACIAVALCPFFVSKQVATSCKGGKREGTERRYYGFFIYLYQIPAFQIRSFIYFIVIT